MRLTHLAARLYGTPLLIHRARLDVILSVLNDRAGRPPAEPSAALPAVGASSLPAPTAPPGIAVIPVQGTLVKRTGGLDALCGLSSYADIGAMLDAAVRDPAVAGILLDVDSPGGETGGLFELADAVRAADAVKPVWAVADDAAFSAAYAVASAASRVFVTRTGGVGSIGVIALHVDQSVADARDGLRYTAITAGKRKNDGSPHEPLCGEAQARLQAEVDRLYGMFVGQVAAMRGLTEAAVRATDAGLYFGREGVDAGLADTVGSLDEALAEFAAFLTPQGRSRSPVRAQSLPGCAAHSQQEIDMQDIQAPAVPAPEPATDPEAAGAAHVAARIVEARQDMRRETQAIAELCLLAGHAEQTVPFIAAGKTEADVRRALLEMRAAHQSPEIASAIDPDQAASASSAAAPRNPLISAVRKLTAQE